MRRDCHFPEEGRREVGGRDEGMRGGETGGKMGRGRKKGEEKRKLRGRGRGGGVSL